LSLDSAPAFDRPPVRLLVQLVLSAFGKLLRANGAVCAGAGTAAGSFGQFVFAPFGVAMLDNFGWQPALDPYLPV